MRIIFKYTFLLDCLIVTNLFLNNPIYSQSKIDVTFIANEGFLVQTDTTKILFDGIFSEGSGIFVTPTAESLESERNATDPFDNVNFLFVSHVHADHVNPAYLLEHLGNNANGILFTHYQVKAQLELQNQYSSVQNRIKCIADTNRSQFDTVINNVTIKSYAFTHANNNTSVKNLGYLVKVNEFTIFHSGDSDPEIIDTFKLYNLASENIDIAFIHRGFFDSGNSGTGIKIINYLKPKVVFLMHVKIGDFNKYRNRLEDITDVPVVYLIEDQMSKKSFIHNGDNLVEVGDTTSVQQNQSPNKTNLIVTPNPSCGWITISTDDNSNMAGQIQIFDITGKLVRKLEMNSNKPVNVNMDNLPKGIYAIIYSDSEIVLSQKIVLD